MRNRDDQYLPWTEPERPLARKVLRGNRDESLQAPQNRTMYHHRPVHSLLCLLAFTSGSWAALVGPAILELESLGKLEVELNGGALEGSFQRVLDANINLGAVERAVTWVQFPFPWNEAVQGVAELL